MLTSQHRLGRGRRLLFIFLLLLLFGIIANGQDEEYEVGFGKHKLKDGKVHLDPDWDGTTNTDCDVQESDDKKQIFVSRKYPDDKGCTVELVTSDGKDEFEFQAIVKPKEEGKTLADCISASDLDNTIQFNYGKNNKELEHFKKEPFYNEKGECPDETQCKNNGGTKCMDSTSLEILWSKDGDDNYDFVLIPLGEFGLAESESKLSWKPTEIAGKNIARVHFKILKNPKKCRGAYEINKATGLGASEIEKSTELKPVCIYKKNAVPPPIFWPILDKEGNEIEGKKRLLVFHLLPLGASILDGPSKPQPPKCRLSFGFAADKYPLLSKEVLTVEKTTTTMNSTASAPSTTESSSGMGPLFYAAIIGGTALIVAGIGILLVWLCVCRGKGKKDTDSSSGEDGEEAEDGEAASVPSDACIGTNAEQKSTSFYVDTALTSPDNNRKRSS